MRSSILTVTGFVLLAIAGCVQVGPSDDKPMHIILDINVRVQVDKAVESLWNEVEARAAAAAAAAAGVPTPDTVTPETER